MDLGLPKEFAGTGGELLSVTQDVPRHQGRASSSDDRTDERADHCRYTHYQRTPNQYAGRTTQHGGTARARREGAQHAEERERDCGDEDSTGSDYAGEQRDETAKRKAQE